MLEYNQTQQELQRLEGERQAHIARLGESMYGMWRSNQFSREEFEALCRDIRRCEEGIDECRHRLEASPPPPPVPDWGPGPQIPPAGPAAPSNPQAPLSGPLGGPGAHVSPAEPAGHPDPRPAALPGAVCPCGNINPAGARFCTRCGHPLA